VEQGLEVEASIRGDRATGQRSGDNNKGAETFDEKVRLRGEKEPLNRIGPERGCGMKQACKLVRGENRREAVSA